MNKGGEFSRLTDEERREIGLIYQDAVKEATKIADERLNPKGYVTIKSGVSIYCGDYSELEPNVQYISVLIRVERLQ